MLHCNVTVQFIGYNVENRRELRLKCAKNCVFFNWQKRNLISEASQLATNVTTDRSTMLRISHYVSDTTRNGNSRRVYNSSRPWAINNGANLFLSVTAWKFNGFWCSFSATVCKTVRLMLSTYRRRMSVTPENFFKNLNVKYWIFVHFHAESGVFYTEYLNIKWTNWRFMHEKVGGGQKALFDPALEKVGSIDPLDPVLPRSIGPSDVGRRGLRWVPWWPKTSQTGSAATQRSVRVKPSFIVFSF